MVSSPTAALASIVNHAQGRLPRLLTPTPGIQLSGGEHGQRVCIRDVVPLRHQITKYSVQGMLQPAAAASTEESVFFLLASMISGQTENTAVCPLMQVPVLSGICASVSQSESNVRLHEMVMKARVCRVLAATPTATRKKAVSNWRLKRFPPLSREWDAPCGVRR